MSWASAPASFTQRRCLYAAGSARERDVGVAGGSCGHAVATGAGLEQDGAALAHHEGAFPHLLRLGRDAAHEHVVVIGIVMKDAQPTCATGAAQANAFLPRGVPPTHLG